MSAINVNSITGRTGAHGPVLTGVTTVSGDLDVTGKVSVAGTVSYEDVANVDSVGIITAQAGIRVTGGDLYSTSAGGRIGVGTNTALRQLEVFSATHATAAIKGNTQSSLFLVDSDDSNIGQISYDHSVNDMYFRVNDAERLRITSSGNVGLASAIPKTNFDLSQKTGAVALPQGTQAQRPTGSEGYMRFNTESKSLEIYDGSNWVEIISDYFPSGSVVLG